MEVRRRNPDRVEHVVGPCTVGELLARLDVNPTTVLVIADGALVTAGVELPDDASVEVRPVMSGGSGAPPRCRVCAAPAVHEEPRHRSAWCAEHLVDHVERQVRRAIDDGSDDGGRMFSYGDRVLVAVSGGKDSLALWEVLLRLGYDVDGLYLGLGIGGYSSRSHAVVERFHAERTEPLGARLHVVDLEQAQGFSTPQGAAATGRPACGVCGLSKRYWFNRAAVEHGYPVMATGHNLDDEAAVLLGNVLRWQDGFLARQRPVLEGAGTNRVRKVKPLYRLSERETAAYCVVRGIDYVVEECPLVDGNTGAANKDVLDELERASPGIKAQFLFGFLDRAARRWPREEHDDVTLVACAGCDMPTPAPRDDAPARCGFCRQQDRAAGAAGLSGPRHRVVGRPPPAAGSSVVGRP
jgi:tRNA(Ile)-lysidine synthase TilS/MesJ/sulfur carrier protein ThiS